MIEYQKGAEAFLDIYKQLKNRYCSLKDRFEAEEEILFGHEFIDDYSSIASDSNN